MRPGISALNSALGPNSRDRLTARLAYTYQDFPFHDDPVRGDKRLAGAPTHLIHAALQYQATENWALQAAAKWVPDKTPVDNMNTLYADPYAVVDLRTEYRIGDNVSLFGEVTKCFRRNLRVVHIDRRSGAARSGGVSSGRWPRILCRNKGNLLKRGAYQDLLAAGREEAGFGLWLAAIGKYVIF